MLYCIFYCEIGLRFRWRGLDQHRKRAQNSTQWCKCCGVATHLEKVSSVCIFQLRLNHLCVFVVTFNSLLCVCAFASKWGCVPLYSIHLLLSVPALEPPPWHNSLSVFLCYVLLILSFNPPEALEKNEQWLEYDQQREAYVRATLARMLWLEKRVNKANQACSQQHNEDHSDGEPKGQWAVGTHHWGNEGQQTVTTRFLRSQDCPRVAHYYRICSLQCIRKIIYFITTWCM